MSSDRTLATTFPIPFRWRALVLAVLAILTLLDVTLLLARDAPSAPFLQKNGFYLESAGFKARFANDPASQAVLRKMPPHRFVLHATPNGPRYFYADPVTCMCIFVGTAAAYQSYRDILAQPIPQPDYVSPDYKTQAGALLSDDPIASDGIDWEPDSLAAAFRDYY
ncbi:MAG: hypothetical protein JWR89_2886 [Tardiphaga sp.]|uniref:hypothetical protein n=1 Tax=Tardiphaga sp. TaxID=1926292 RepID=UPI00261DA372|nr:hypothetical protein [Tardiphaga sp.]MDB5502984.1 hypothetical protein [Tardiphaga sp.]